MGGKITFVQITLFSFAILFPRCFVTLKTPVETKSGKIDGTVFPYKGKAVQAFLGIPFAKPPVGDLRFKKPKPVEPWTHTLQATKFSPACHQIPAPNYPWVDQMPNQSEDCLYLNIWVPPHTNKYSKKAVMFWIYGGGFQDGSNRLPLYDGQVIATEGDILLITINYRLDILGFLLSLTERTEAPGNMGLFDMLTALKWVKDNIEAFGGDNNNITVIGESAGSTSAGMLCISPLSKGIFQRAILQGLSPATIWRCRNQDNALLYSKVAEAVGCADSFDVVKCLRSKDAALLMKTSGALGGTYSAKFSTICGDDFLPGDPKAPLTAGLVHDVDILIGHTQDEGSFFLPETFSKTFGTFGEKSPRVSKTFGKMYMEKILGKYVDVEGVFQYYLGDVKDDDYNRIREQVYHSFGDYFIICPDIYFAENYAKAGKNVYAYYFNHIPSVTPWARWLGAVHSDEVPFIFGRPLDHASNYTATDQYLSWKIVEIWTHFAKHGNPGCESWRQYSREDPYFNVFNPTNRKSYLEIHQKNCDFWRPFTGFV